MTIKTIRARHEGVKALAVLLSLAIPLPSLALGPEEIGKTESPSIISQIQIIPEFEQFGNPNTNDINLHQENLSIDNAKQVQEEKNTNILTSLQKEERTIKQAAVSIDKVQTKAGPFYSTSGQPNAHDKPIGRVSSIIRRIKENLSWGSKRPDPEDSPELSPSSDNETVAPNPTDAPLFVPVSRTVSELKNLSLENPAAAWARAQEILKDPLEKRLIAKAAALDVLSQAPALEFFPSVINLLEVKDSNQWYLSREAAKILGARTADLSADQRQQAIQILDSIQNPESLTNPFNLFLNQTAFPVQTDNNISPEEAFVKKQAKLERDALFPRRSVFNMAQWALRQLGAVPSPIKVETKVATPVQVVGASQQISHSMKIGRILRVMTAILFAAGLLIPILSHNLQVSAPKAPASISQTLQSPAKKNSAAQTEKQASPSDQEIKKIEKHVANMDSSLAQLAQAVKKPQASDSNALTSFFLNFFGPVVLMIGGLFFIMRRFGPGRLTSSKTKNKAITDRPSTRFPDVGGVDESLLEVQEIVDYLKNPLKWQRAGALPPKGVLLIGPSGTGKTLLAKALAGEANVPFMSLTGSDFVEMFVGLGAARVREIFNEARKNKPMIVFIDEIDAVGRKRGANSGSNGDGEREQTLNQLLVEMDGFDGSDGIILMAATNREDVLDPALIRPGRFDRKVYVGNPDTLGRRAILAIHAGKVSLQHDVNLDHVVRRTTGFSGAEIAGLIGEAARLAVRRNAADISPQDLNQAIDKMTVGIARHLALSPEIKRRVAYHESGHVLAGFLAGQPIANKVTIIPHGGQALGYAEPASENEDDTFLLTKTQLQRRLIGMMGGRAAEEIVFGETSTGPGSDIEQAERLARAMVEKMGMDESVGILTSGTEGLGIRRVSEETARQMDLAVKKLLEESLQKAKIFLSEGRATLESLTQALLERETLEKEDIERIVHGR